VPRPEPSLPRRKINSLSAIGKTHGLNGSPCDVTVFLTGPQGFGRLAVPRPWSADVIASGGEDADMILPLNPVDPFIDPEGYRAYIDTPRQNSGVGSCTSPWYKWRFQSHATNAFSEKINGVEWSV